MNLCLGVGGSAPACALCVVLVLGQRGCSVESACRSSKFGEGHELGAGPISAAAQVKEVSKCELRSLTGLQ